MRSNFVFNDRRRRSVRGAGTVCVIESRTQVHEILHWKTKYLIMLVCYLVHVLPCSVCIWKDPFSFCRTWTKREVCVVSSHMIPTGNGVGVTCNLVTLRLRFPVEGLERSSAFFLMPIVRCKLSRRFVRQSMAAEVVVVNLGLLRGV